MVSYGDKEFRQWAYENDLDDLDMVIIEKTVNRRKRIWLLIWLLMYLFPLGESGVLPELASDISIVIGAICVIIFWFGNSFCLKCISWSKTVKYGTMHPRTGLIGSIIGLTAVITWLSVIPFIITLIQRNTLWGTGINKLFKKGLIGNSKNDKDPDNAENKKSSPVVKSPAPAGSGGAIIAIALVLGIIVGGSGAAGFFYAKETGLLKRLTSKSNYSYQTNQGNQWEADIPTVKQSFGYFDLEIPEYWVDNYVTSDADIEYDNIYEEEEKIGIEFYEKESYLNKSEYDSTNDGFLFNILIKENGYGAIGEIDLDKTYYIVVNYPFEWVNNSSTYSNLYCKMYQDSKKVINSISSDKYDIKLYSDNKISNVKDLSEDQIMNHADDIYAGIIWLSDLLAKDYMLNKQDCVNLNQLHEDSFEDIEFPSAYGIKTKEDLRAYLSEYFTDSYIESELMQKNEFDSYGGSWHEYNGNLYFEYNYGRGWYGIGRKHYNIEYTSDTSFIIHTTDGYYDYEDENFHFDGNLDEHFYFVLEDGKLKLDKFVYDIEEQ